MHIYVGGREGKEVDALLIKIFRLFQGIHLDKQIGVYIYLSVFYL